MQRFRNAEQLAFGLRCLRLNLLNASLGKKKETNNCYKHNPFKKWHIWVAMGGNLMINSLLLQKKSKLNTFSQSGPKHPKYILKSLYLRSRCLDVYREEYSDLTIS